MGRLKATACSWKPSRCHRNKGGNIVWLAPQLRRDRASSRCEYHTAIPAAFQLELACDNCDNARLDTVSCKVQTFLDSMTAQEGILRFTGLFAFHHN
jgi:hypothetical protein